MNETGVCEYIAAANVLDLDSSGAGCGFGMLADFVSRAAGQRAAGQTQMQTLVTAMITQAPGLIQIPMMPDSAMCGAYQPSVFDPNSCRPDMCRDTPPTCQAGQSFYDDDMCMHLVEMYDCASGYIAQITGPPDPITGSKPFTCCPNAQSQTGGSAGAGAATAMMSALGTIVPKLYGCVHFEDAQVCVDLDTIQFVAGMSSFTLGRTSDPHGYTVDANVALPGVHAAALLTASAQMIDDAQGLTGGRVRASATLDNLDMQDAHKLSVSARFAASRSALSGGGYESMTFGAGTRIVRRSQLYPGLDTIAEASMSMSHSKTAQEAEFLASFNLEGESLVPAILDGQDRRASAFQTIYAHINTDGSTCVDLPGRVHAELGVTLKTLFRTVCQLLASTGATDTDPAAAHTLAGVSDLCAELEATMGPDTAAVTLDIKWKMHGEFFSSHSADGYNHAPAYAVTAELDMTSTGLDLPFTWKMFNAFRQIFLNTPEQFLSGDPNFGARVELSHPLYVAFQHDTRADSAGRLGLQWLRERDTTRPLCIDAGTCRELTNAGLKSALERETRDSYANKREIVFSPQEWEALGISDLRINDYIQAVAQNAPVDGSGNYQQYYFSPATGHTTRLWFGWPKQPQDREVLASVTFQADFWNHQCDGAADNPPQIAAMFRPPVPNSPGSFQWCWFHASCGRADSRIECMLPFSHGNCGYKCLRRRPLQDIFRFDYRVELALKTVRGANGLMELDVKLRGRLTVLNFLKEMLQRLPPRFLTFIEQDLYFEARIGPAQKTVKFTFSSGLPETFEPDWLPDFVPLNLDVPCDVRHVCVKLDLEEMMYDNVNAAGLSFCEPDEHPVCGLGQPPPSLASPGNPFRANVPSCPRGIDTSSVEVVGENFYTMKPGQSCPAAHTIRSQEVCRQAAQALGLTADGDVREEWPASSSSLPAYCSFVLNPAAGQDLSRFAASLEDLSRFASSLDFSKRRLHFNFGRGRDARRRSKRHGHSHAETQAKMRASVSPTDLCAVCVSQMPSTVKACTPPAVENGIFELSQDTPSTIFHGSLLDDSVGTVSCSAGFVRSHMLFDCECSTDGAACQTLQGACLSLHDASQADCLDEYTACQGTDGCLSTFPNTPEGAALAACLDAEFVWKVGEFPPCASACGPRPDTTREAEGCEMVMSDGRKRTVELEKCEGAGSELPDMAMECPSFAAGTACDDGFDESIDDQCVSPDLPVCEGLCAPGWTDDQSYSVHWLVAGSGSDPALVEGRWFDERNDAEAFFTIKKAAARAPSGLKWLNAGTTKPAGLPLNHSKLVEFLTQKEAEQAAGGDAGQAGLSEWEFDPDEWHAFNITELSTEHFVKVANSYFKPEAPGIHVRMYTQSGIVMKQYGDLTADRWKAVDSWRGPCSKCEAGFYKELAGKGFCRGVFLFPSASRPPPPSLPLSRARSLSPASPLPPNTHTHILPPFPLLRCVPVVSIRM